MKCSGFAIARVALCLCALVWGYLLWGCEEEMRNHEAEILQIHFVQRVGRDTMHVVSDTLRPMSTTLTLQVSHAADLSSLMPVFDLSAGARADCTSGQSYDFREPFRITVTAANGTNRRTYHLTLSRLPSPPVIEPDEPDLNGETTLSDFSLEGVEARVTVKGTRVYFEVPEGTDITALSPRFQIAEGATVDYALGSAHDFREPLYLRVTSEDQLNVTTYRLFVRFPDPVLASEAQVLSFRFHESDQDAEIDGSQIYATVRAGSDLTRLVPTFKLSQGARASLKGHESGDFSGPVRLEVESEDGSAKSVYTVRTEVRLGDQARLEEVLVLPMGEATLRDEQGFTWMVEDGIDVSSLRTYVRLGAGCTANIANGAYVNYQEPQRLVVRSEDGLTERGYMLRVQRMGGEPPDEKGLIETWGFSNAPTRVVIHRNEIHCRVPAGTDLRELIPSFTIKHNPAWVTLSRPYLMRGDNNSIEVESEKTSLDFTTPRTFEVWRKNPWLWETSRRSLYTVYVTEDSPAEGEARLLGLTFRDVDSRVKIRGSRVDVTVPSGTDLRALVPEVRLTANAVGSLSPGSAADFREPVELVVTSGGGNARRTYRIEVTARQNDAASVEEFTFQELTSRPEIHGARIVMHAGPDVDMTRLTPRVVVSRGARCTLESGVARDFSAPVTFDVTSEDGSLTRRYTVRVEQRLNSEAELLHFRFRELDSPCEITGSRVQMPALPTGVSATSLTPEYVISSGAVCSLAQGVTGDFSRAVRFTVTSQDGAKSKSYTVRRALPSIQFDFEEWQRVGSGTLMYEHPVGGWSSGNAGTAVSKNFFGRPERYPVRRSTEAHSGASAAAISTEHLDVYGNSIAAGALWLGGFKADNIQKDPLSGPQFGMAWPGGTPATFKGWYKYQPGPQLVNKGGGNEAGTDELDMYAVLFHGGRLDGHTIESSGQIVAIAKLRDLSARSEYTPFEVEFEEVNGGIRAGEALQYTIVLSSSRRGASFIGAVGSLLLVDDLEITLK